MENLKLNDNLPQNSKDNSSEGPDSHPEQEKRLAPIFLPRTPTEVKFQENVTDLKTPNSKRKRANEENKKISRTRTPSGQVLTGKVDDTKQILFPTPDKHGKERRDYNIKALLNDSQSTVNAFTPIPHQGRGSKSSKTITTRSMKSADLQVQQTQKGENERQPHQSLTSIEEEIKEQGEGGNAFKAGEGLQAASELSNATVCTDTFVDNTMDVRTVMKMFETLKADLKTELGEMKADIQALTTTGQASEEGKAKTQKIVTAIDDYEKKLAANEVKWKNQEIRNTVQEGAIGRLNCIVTELQTKIERMEIQNAKKMLIISGFYASEKRNVCRQQLEYFFSHDMGVDIEIEELYFSGSFTPPNIIITLQSQAEKRMIYRNIGKIKTFVNRDGRKIIFKDFLLAAEHEKRKYQEDVKRENESRSPELQQDISFRGNRVLISGMELPQYVTVPDPTKVLQMKQQELEKIMNLDVKYGPQLVAEGNTIMAAAKDVADFTDVNNAYLAVKLKYAGARHIVAAWNIPTELKIDGQNFCDDGDHGIGREILNMMKENDISHKAVFLIRYCSKKLQQVRFDMYKTAFIKLLEKFPANSILGTDQQIQHTDEASNNRAAGKDINKTAKQRDLTNSRGRKGGQGKPRNTGSRKKYEPRDNSKNIEFEPISEQKLKEKRNREMVNSGDRFGGNYASAVLGESNSSRTGAGSADSMWQNENSMEH